MCLIEVTAQAGMTVYIIKNFFFHKESLTKPRCQNVIKTYYSLVSLACPFLMIAPSVFSKIYSQCPSWLISNQLLLIKQTL
jgi:hypothetical protein